MDTPEITRDDIEVEEAVKLAAETLNAVLNRARARQMSVRLHLEPDDNGNLRVVADALRPMKPMR